MLQIFGFLSGILPFLSILPYDRDIFRKKTKPHRGSFLIWSILGSIAFFSQLAKGATWSLFLPGADTLGVSSIFILSLRYGTGGLSKRDAAGLLLAAFGLALWYFTNQPLAALFIVICVDAVGTILTVLKTYETPHSETFSSWLMCSIGGLFGMLAVGKVSYALLLYPFYIFLANGAVNVTIFLGKRKTSIV